jgi:hypothetical protein
MSQQRFASHPGRRNPLYESVRNLDRALACPLRRNALAPSQARQLLAQVEAFYQTAQQQQESERMPETAEAKALLAAGCRLSSDLNETVLLQLVEQVQEQDTQIAALSRALAQQLFARAQTRQLLKHAHRLRQCGVKTAESAGLGVIL